MTIIAMMNFNPIPLSHSPINIQKRKKEKKT